MPTGVFHTMTFLTAAVLTLCWSESLLHVAEQMVPEVEMDPMEWSSEEAEVVDPIAESEATPAVEESPTTEKPEPPETAPSEAAGSAPPEDAQESEPIIEQTVAETEHEEPPPGAPPEVAWTTDSSQRSAPQTPETTAGDETASTAEVTQLVGDEAGSLASFAGESPTGEAPETGETEGSGHGMKISFVFIGRPKLAGGQQRSPLWPVLMRQSGEGVEVAVINQGGPGQPVSLNEFSQRSPQFSGHTFVRLPRDWMVGLHGWTLGRGHGWAMYLAVSDPLFREWMQLAEQFAGRKKVKLTDVGQLRGELRFSQHADGKPTLRFIGIAVRPAQTTLEKSQ